MATCGLKECGVDALTALEAAPGHRPARGRGDMARTLNKSAAWINIKRLVEPVPYADYLQRDGVNI